MKLFTVGPVEMFENIKEMGKDQIPYFRNAYFSDVMKELDYNLKTLFHMSPNDKNIFLTASGTGAMEAVVMNCLSEKDKVLVISGGGFGERFEELCRIHNIPYEVLRIPYGESFCEEALKKLEQKEYTAMLVNIHETSIGQLYPITILSEFCQKKQMMFIVDAISSAFADEIDFSEYAIDVMIYSSQKALALAPGISVVALKESVVKNRIGQNMHSMYFDFSAYLENMERGQTPFTPAIGILLQMHIMVKELVQMGLEKKVAYTNFIAEDFRKKLQKAHFKMPDYPLSNALTPILFKGDAEVYYRKLIEDYDITVNPCGGKLKSEMLRVGHMGNLKVEDNDLLIDALCRIRREKKYGNEE